MRPSRRYTYDAKRRLSGSERGGGEQREVERYEYPEPADAPLTCDQPLRIHDARGGIKQLSYTAAGQLASYTDCSGQTTRYRYDRFGELIEVIDALGRRTRHERDAQGRIRATHLADGQIERYAYNEQGLLAQIQPPADGHPIALGYDLWGRLTRREHAGLTLGFVYDVAGRLTELINENAARSRFGWDVMDRLVREEGFDGRRQRYHWDRAGQLSQSQDGRAHLSSTTRYRWDEAGRLIHTEHLDPEHPGERQITHTVYEPHTFTPMLRLSTRGKAAAKPHRLVQALQERADEPEDEAALASLQAALQALPASMQQSLNEATAQALEQGLPASALTMLGEEGPATKQHLDRMNKRLQEEAQQQKPPVEIHFYHCDHLGTPIALTDRNHHVIWAAKLDPWGNLEEEYNPNRIDQPLRLPGQHHDRETGLYYNRHRYYDPGLGSYISQDPIGLSGNFNTVIYPKNPLSIIDPEGLDQVSNGTGNAFVYTDIANGKTTFFDPNGRAIFEMATSNLVTKNAKPGAAGPYDGKFTYCEYPENSKAYGAAKWRTTDPRARWIHGGGSGLKDPFAPRQGWNPTLGCTRAQNEDIKKLCEISEKFLENNPGRSIDYIRSDSLENNGVTQATRQ